MLKPISINTIRLYKSSELQSAKDGELSKLYGIIGHDGKLHKFIGDTFTFDTSILRFLEDYSSVVIMDWNPVNFWDNLNVIFSVNGLCRISEHSSECLLYIVNNKTVYSHSAEDHTISRHFQNIPKNINKPITQYLMFDKKLIVTPSHEYDILVNDKSNRKMWYSISTNKQYETNVNGTICLEGDYDK